VNKKQIIKLKPGRKLDKLIAAKIFGYKVADRRGFWDPDCGEFLETESNPYTKNKVPCILVETKQLSEEEKIEYSEEVKSGVAHFIPDRHELWAELPHYSTSISDSFIVEQKLQEKWDCIDLIWDCGSWDIHLEKYGTLRDFYLGKEAGETYEQLPEAICRTALLSILEVENNT